VCASFVTEASSKLPVALALLQDSTVLFPVVEKWHRILQAGIDSYPAPSSPAPSNPQRALYGRLPSDVVSTSASGPSGSDGGKGEEGGEEEEEDQLDEEQVVSEAAATKTAFSSREEFEALLKLDLGDVQALKEFLA
jgi:hypothetical protein